MYKLVGVLLSVLLTGLAAGSWAVDTAVTEAQIQLRTGEKLLGAGDLGQAETELSSLITQYPGTDSVPWARVRLAECYFHQDRFDDCILESRRAVNLYRDLSQRAVAAWAQVYVGLGYKGKGQLDAEIWELQKVRQVLGDDPNHKPLLKASIELALAHHNRNDRKEAMALAGDVLADPTAQNADRAWAGVVLGSALVGEWRLDEGLAELQKVRDRYADLQDQVQMAEAKIFDRKYIGRHDYDGAIKEAKLILAAPNVSEGRASQAMYTSALAQLYKGDNDQAIGEAGLFISRYPARTEDCRRCYSILARAYAKKKDYDHAISSLQAELDTKPTDPELCAAIEWDLATCYKVLGDTTSAADHYHRIANLYSGSHLSIRATQELAKSGGQ